VKRVEQLLRERIGLDPASIGSSSIQRIVRLRMKLLGVARVDDYLKSLEEVPVEWRELIESVVVSETWFNRDLEAIRVMVQWVQEEWLPRNPLGRARVLSVPCSSGEEPYSIAMALREVGVPVDRFEIEGVDLSARSLERARRGIYGRNSFRGRNINLRRFFTAVGQTFVLAPEIKSLVQFREGNLLDAGFAAAAKQYDFIFCRNLLIYFDRATQEKAMRALQHLLAPSGALFVGPAELPLALEGGFISAGVPMAFACRKASYKPANRHPAPRRARSSPAPPQPYRFSPAASPASTSARPPQKAPPKPQVDLREAYQLADAGRLAEAARVCEEFLRTRPDSAPAHYLLGLIRDGMADTSAIECYRKALYLQPDHYDSLVQMAWHAEKHGKIDLAQTYRRRAERACPAPPSA
jgi:chemotaxis protein methyltransferase WspC